MKKAVYLAAMIALFATARGYGADSLAWNSKQATMDADIQTWDVTKLLRKIAASTGWKVFVEPGLNAKVSVKFKNQPDDEALRRLLGKVNFFRDESNGVPRLFVFNTTQSAATQAVRAESKKEYRIPNELLVKLKRNSKETIEQLAKRLGAKIVGRDDRNGFYRLQFADANSADASLVSLNSDSNVEMAGSNYSVDRPAPVTLASSGPAPAGLGFNLSPVNNGHVVGLVDTTVNVGDAFKQYMLTPVSVVGTSEEPAGEPTHGTAMFETMLQAMASDPSKILPVDVYGSGDSTTTFDVMEGIVKAINMGANPINLSLGGTGQSDMMGALISEAESKGIVFIAASGNTPGTELTYPAAYAGVTAVTASDPSGKLASYADDGSFVDTMQPGTSSFPWNGGEWTVEGTSPATATFTGKAVDLANHDNISFATAANMLIKIYPPPK